MSSENRMERFKRAKEARERAEKEKANGSFGSVEVPQFQTVCLNPNKSHVIRFIGNAIEMSTEPTDPIIVNRSMVKGDDDKWFTIIWSDDMEHPMNKLKKTVLGKYKWDNELKTRIYENKDFSTFKRFMSNGIEGNPYNQGMNPQKFILFNVIDRDDNWCKENKHTKLLCWESNKVEKDGNINEYPTYGIKLSLYNKVWDEYCTIRNRHFEDFDVLVRRLDKNTKIGDNGYLVVNIAEERSAIMSWESKDGVKYLDKMNDNYLSDEEAKYEKYVLKDIPFISKPTPCGVILAHLSKFIKEVDTQFGTKLYDEFIEMKVKEIEELKKESSEKENVSTETKVEEEKVTFDKMESIEETSTNDELPSEVEESVVETPHIKKVVKKVTNSFDPMSLVNELPEIANLSEDDRKLIVGVKDDGSLKFKDDDEAECPTCGNSIHSDMMKCPFCGQDFAE